MPDDAVTFLRTVNDLLKGHTYDWARPTLEGIRLTVTLSGTVTPRQQQAVEHIITGRLTHDVGPT